MFKKYTVILVICVCLVGCILCIIAYYSPAEKQEGLSIIKHDDDTIRIAYIGDSWAHFHEDVCCEMDSIISDETAKPVKVRIEGVGGLTSKRIYDSLFKVKAMRRVIEWGPDFCFVVAGINDSDRKMGTGFYKENMRLIIDLLLENHIIPIILEIPSYDINSAFKRRSFMGEIRYLASMLMTRSKMDCIDEYRKVYHELIDEQGWNEQVITILHQDWNPDGYLDKRGLYNEDHIHLNVRGYQVLDSCIAQKIVDYFSSRENHLRIYDRQLGGY